MTLDRSKEMRAAIAGAQAQMSELRAMEWQEQQPWRQALCDASTDRECRRAYRRIRAIADRYESVIAPIRAAVADLACLLPPAPVVVMASSSPDFIKARGLGDLSHAIVVHFPGGFAGTASTKLGA